MIESLFNPKKLSRRPWELFFVGLIYASFSYLIVGLFFSRDSVLSDASGILLVIFTIMCSMPFIYYTIKKEENADVEITNSGRLMREHEKAVRSFMWLFLGFVVAFSFWYLAFPSTAGQNFNFQVRTFCMINSPSNFNFCMESYGAGPTITGAVTSGAAVLGIFSNNISVMIATILFSLIFGAGAIFILVWNASVIASAIGIFAKGQMSQLPFGILRYMVHGIPEIAAYFVAALAGGIVSVAVIRRDLQGERMWRILQDALTLIIVAILILVVAALMEVYITPLFFH